MVDFDSFMDTFQHPSNVVLSAHLAASLDMDRDLDTTEKQRYIQDILDDLVNEGKFRIEYVPLGDSDE